MVALTNVKNDSDLLWEKKPTEENFYKSESSKPVENCRSETRNSLPIECLAHDVNNMLNTILGYSQILKRVKSSLSEEEVTEYIDKIQKATLRAAELIKEYRHDSLKIEKCSQKVDVNKALYEVADYMKSSQANQVNVQVVPLLNGILIDGNTTLLVHALMNLALNACRAMDNCGSLTIIADTVLPLFIGGNEKCVRIRMIDTGSGMDDKTLRKILLSRFTTKYGEGHGIGLQNVRKSILDQGGRISVKSRIGHGTEFTILFPIKKRDERRI